MNKISEISKYNAKQLLKEEFEGKLSIENLVYSAGLSCADHVVIREALKLKYPIVKQVSI